MSRFCILVIGFISLSLAFAGRQSCFSLRSIHSYNLSIKGFFSCLLGRGALATALVERPHTLLLLAQNLLLALFTLVCSDCIGLFRNEAKLLLARRFTLDPKAVVVEQPVNVVVRITTYGLDALYRNESQMHPTQGSRLRTQVTCSSSVTRYLVRLFRNFSAFCICHSVTDQSA
jgi:hypothetical protein